MRSYYFKLCFTVIEWHIHICKHMYVWWVSWSWYKIYFLLCIMIKGMKNNGLSQYHQSHSTYPVTGNKMWGYIFWGFQKETSLSNTDPRLFFFSFKYASCSWSEHYLTSPGPAGGPSWLRVWQVTHMQRLWIFLKSCTNQLWIPCPLCPHPNTHNDLLAMTVPYCLIKE